MGSPTFDRHVFVKKTQSPPPPRSPLPGALALLIVAALAAFGTYRYVKAGGGTTSNSADKAQIKQLQQKLKVMQARVKELEKHRVTRVIHVADKVRPEKAKTGATKLPHALLAEDAPHAMPKMTGDTHHSAVRAVTNNSHTIDPKTDSHARKSPPPTPDQAASKPQPLLASTHPTSSKELNALQSGLAANNDQWQATTDRLGNMVGQLDSQHTAIQKNQNNVNYLMELAHRTNVDFTLRKGRRYQRIGPISMRLAGTSVRNQHYSIRLIVDDKSVELKDRALNEVVQFFTSQSKYPLELVVSQIKRDQVSGTLVVPYDLARKLNNIQLQEK